VAVITIPEAQAWLEATKLTIASLDVELEEAVRTIVFGKVSAAYDTSGWTTDVNTPELVKKAVAMYYAGAFYTRQYSEENPDGTPYGKWLMGLADDLLEGVAGGTVDLPEVVTPAPAAEGPTFFPTDASTALDEEETGVGISFTMGKTF
jgi:hypothetical protein